MLRSAVKKKKKVKWNTYIKIVMKNSHHPHPLPPGSLQRQPVPIAFILVFNSLVLNNMLLLLLLDFSVLDTTWLTVVAKESPAPASQHLMK